MVRSVVSKVLWVGRATVFMVGLAVILAVVLGVATAALGTTGQNFILGKANNTAENPTGLVSTLADAAKSALIVQNKSGGAALDLKVGNATTPANDVAPMRVNSSKVVTNLNADRVDGQSFSCPGGTLLHEGVCIETTMRFASAFGPASNDCLDEGRRLPSVEELQTFRKRSGHDFTDTEWSSRIDLYTESSFMVHAVQSSNGLVFMTKPNDPSYMYSYRCVVPAS